MESLGAMLPRDVHYILNVQCEVQSEYAYLIVRKESIYIQRLGRYELIPEIHLGCGEAMMPEMRSVVLCLTDYMLEMKKMMGQQAGNLQETKAKDAGGSDRRRVSKYFTQGLDVRPQNIMLPDVDKEIQERELAEKDALYRGDYL